MAETKVINLEVKTNSASLKAQLREAQNEVNALADKFGATSQEAINAAKRAAELKDAIGDAKALTDSFNPDAKFNALSNSIGGVLNGFQAFEGALGLVGVEGEQVQKTLLKVQSAMALSQGLQGLGESIDSFKQLGAVIKSSAVFQNILTAAQSAYTLVVGASTGAVKAFRLALATTGIGALIVGIGFLVEKLTSFSGASESAAESQKKLNDQLEAQNTIIERNKKNLQDNANFQVNYAKAVGASEEKILELQKKGIADRDLQRKQELFLVDDQIKELRKKYIAAYVDEDFERAKEIQKQIKDKQKLKGDLINEEFSLKQDLKLLEANYNKEQALEQREKNKQAEEKRKKELEDERQRLINIQNLENARLLEQERLENEHYDRFKTAQELEVQAVKDKYFTIIELTKENETLKLAQQKEIDAINDKYKQERLKTEGEQLRAYYESIMADNKRLAEQEKAIQEAKFKATRDTFSAIGDLAQVFAGKSERQQKRAFEIQKAANIGIAIMDTYKAANAAFASGSEINPIFGALSAAAAITAGLLNVRNIANQQFGGSRGSIAPTGSTPSTNNTQSQPPTFNVIGQTAQTQIAQSQQPIRAFVVSNEVTTQQALDRNRLRNATL